MSDREKKIRVAVIGLGFGMQFVPIYQRHPNSELAAICGRGSKEKLDAVGDQFDVKKRYLDYKELLKDDEIDAVHIVTPCEEHSWMSIAAMEAGKHCACTVPVGMSIDEIKAVVKAKKATGKVFMMMETTLYTREFLYIKNMYERGKMGKIQFVRGSHLQDMSLAGWSTFWNGLPPMWYGTHAIGPCLEMAGGLAESVVCHGSGRIREDYVSCYGSPFSFETATIKVKDSDVVTEVTRFVHGATRQYCETIDVYGEKASFEWNRVSDGEQFLFDGGENAKKMFVPDAEENLPFEIASFTKRGQAIDKEHNSFLQGGGHGGSYPHLVHEYISAIVENRESAIDAVTAANWSAVGFCSHESAMNGGERIIIPDFENI